MLKPTKLMSLKIWIAIANEANPLCQNECWRVGDDPTICICEELTELMSSPGYQEAYENRQSTTVSFSN